MVYLIICFLKSVWIAEKNIPVKNCDTYQRGNTSFQSVNSELNRIIPKGYPIWTRKQFMEKGRLSLYQAYEGQWRGWDAQVRTLRDKGCFIVNILLFLFFPYVWRRRPSQRSIFQQNHKDENWRETHINKYLSALSWTRQILAGWSHVGPIL